MGSWKTGEVLNSKPDAARRKELKALYRKQEEEKARAKRYLSRRKMDALQRYLENALEEAPCDDTLAQTMRWVQERGGRGIDPRKLKESLAAFGAFCDCEVVLNVDYDSPW